MKSPPLKKPYWSDDVPYCSDDCPHCTERWMCNLIGDIAEINGICIPMVQQIVRSYHAHMEHLLKTHHWKSIREWQEKHKDAIQEDDKKRKRIVHEYQEKHGVK